MHTQSNLCPSPFYLQYWELSAGRCPVILSFASLRHLPVLLHYQQSRTWSCLLSLTSAPDLDTETGEHRSCDCDKPYCHYRSRAGKYDIALYVFSSHIFFPQANGTHLVAQCEISHPVARPFSLEGEDEYMSSLSFDTISPTVSTQSQNVFFGADSKDSYEKLRSPISRTSIRPLS